MSQAIGDVLQNRNYSEPPEIRLIKEFVLAEIGVTPSVSVNSDTFIVKVPGAAAAGALRTRLFRLQKQLGGKRRVIIRIG